MSTMHGNGAAMAARDWAQTLVPYRRASAARAILELAVTVLPFIALWTAMLVASRHGQYWLSFVMAPFAAGLLVRLFMIQHDCGHGAFLPSKIANDWIGRAIGVVTMTPYDHWRRSHAIHHATSGNLDRRGIGDIKTLTVREYLSRGWRDRLRYRLYRHPLVMRAFIECVVCVTLPQEAMKRPHVAAKMAEFAWTTCAAVQRNDISPAGGASRRLSSREPQRA